MVARLLKLRSPKTISEAVEIIHAGIGTPRCASENTVHQLIEIELLVRESTLWSELDSSRTWNALGWRDALDFHLATRNMIWRHSYKSGAEKPPIMTYRRGGKLIAPDRPRPTRRLPETIMARIPLPPLSPLTGSRPYFQVLHERRTCRRFKVEPLRLQVVSDALGYALQVHHVKAGRPYRAAPTYSLGSYFSVYLLASVVEDIDAGVYFYEDQRHELLMLKRQPCDRLIVALAEDQPYLENIGAALLVCINWDQYMWKYRASRAYRLAIFEIAGLVQTLLLGSTAAGLATFLTPAIDDKLAAATCGISEQLLETPLYIVGLGIRAAGQNQDDHSSVPSL
jgi:SagB-type dehydrogenase family enzyme